MDSWTEKQMALMTGGGNNKCNQYLQSKGIGPRTPIKQKYENDHAQLYKEILKARVEGRPEPTSLPQKSASAPPSMNRPMGNMSGAAGGGGARDANGMERLTGESEQQYVARQTRLRDDARGRMQAKFGNNGGRMGGVGSSGMQGIGSNPNYNPGGAGYDVVSGVTSVFSSGLSLVGNAAGSVASAVQDENTKKSISNIGSSVTSSAGSFWSSFSTGVSQVASSITQPDDDDGLMSLQQQFHSQRPSQSKYGGFGSDTNAGGSGGGSSSRGMTGGSSALAESPGLPGEDRNGIAKLTGESDEQYVARQTQIRDEAKARMAAKFGGGGLSSASSSNSSPYKQTPSQPTGNYNPSYNSAPSSGNFSMNTTPAPRSGGVPQAPRSGGMPAQAPRSGGLVPQAPRSGGMAPVRKLSADSGDDFFASFGA
jgi:ADP-ribosylation factor GTPase-activating protein 1